MKKTRKHNIDDSNIKKCSQIDGYDECDLFHTEEQQLVKEEMELIYHIRMCGNNIEWNLGHSVGLKPAKHIMVPLRCVLSGGFYQDGHYLGII